MTFKALLAAKTDGKITTSVVEMNEQDLMPGDVTVAVDYSTVNYKRWPLPGARRSFASFPSFPVSISLEQLRHPPIPASQSETASSPTAGG
jgi:acrylyl-CoA reductase (NADPH)